jgi:hypothetical protein
MKSIPKPKKPKRSSNVPGQALGYSLQFTRMAAMLFESGPGGLVSFEVFDDVGAESPDGTRTFVQTKSALRGNPLADGSVELWKTIANWVDAIRDQPRDSLKPRFVIYVSRPVTGSLAEKFHAAKTPEAAKAAIAEARQLLLGSMDGLPERSNLNPDLTEQLDRVLLAPLEAVTWVIQAFEIERGSGSPQADFAQILQRHYVPANRLETVANYAAGWVKREVDKLLEQRKPAIIAWSDFEKEMTGFIRKVAERDILQSFAPDPSPSDTARLLPRVFVQQLELIGLDFTDRLDAVSQFFKSSFDRTKWGESGDVHPSSLDDLDERLMQTWKHKKRRTFIEASEKDEAAKGQILFSDCMLHQDKLEGADTPSHFIPGCFHLLADELRVGWHPDFAAEMKRRRRTESA